MMKNSRNRWGLNLILLSGIMILGTLFTAYGAEDRENQEKIKKIKLFIDSSIDEAGSEALSVRTTSQQYHVSSYEFINQNGDWEAGEEPKLRIYVDAEDECYFQKNMSKSSVSVSGAACTALQITGDLETAQVTVKLKPVEGILGTVESAWWDSGSPGKAKWSAVDHAKAYEVKLYRGNTMVDHKDKVKGTNCDFYPKMDRQGSYTFKVRAIPSDSEEKKYLSEGDWKESEEQEIDKQQAALAPQGSGTPSSGSGSGNGSGHSGSLGNRTGGPSSTSGGYTAGGSTPGTLTPPDYGWIVVQNQWKYRNLDGSFPTNGWQFIDGKWYLFDMSGFMLSGWQHYGGKDYYLNSSGDMVTGWFQENRAWYYFGVDGAKVTGWLYDGLDWYFLGPDGVMATGWLKWEDKFYYMNPENGRMLTNTFVDQRYIGPDGVWVP